jgi:hypothetical protein
MYEGGLIMNVQGFFYISMLGGSLVTRTWRVLRLQIEGRPPAMKSSCEYIE